MNKEMKIKPGYKKTPVGIIPEDWEVKEFKRCFTQLKTYTYSRTQLTLGYQNNNIYNIHYGDIHAKYSENILDTEKDLRLIPKIINEKIDNPVLLQDGDVIMADASEDYKGIGKAIELKNVEGKKIIGGTHTFALRPKINFAPKFAGYIFSSFITHKQIKRIATGISVFGISKENISKIKLPIPPLPEQKAIADCLSTWDRGIEKLTALINAKKEQKKGLMQQIFNGQLTMVVPGDEDNEKLAKGDFYLRKTKPGEDGTAHWKEVRLGELFEIGNGKDYKHLNQGSIPVYGTGGLMTYVDECLHNGESVAIGRKGTINKPQFLEGKFWTVDTLFYTYSYRETFPLFIYYLFNTINWLKYNEASGVPSLSQKTIKEIKIKLPPLEEQTAIAEVLTTADREIELLEKKLEAMKEQKKGLMQVLLTGEKRLITEDNN